MAGKHPDNSAFFLIVLTGHVLLNPPGGLLLSQRDVPVRLTGKQPGCFHRVAGLKWRRQVEHHPAMSVAVLPCSQLCDSKWRCSMHIKNKDMLRCRICICGGNNSQNQGPPINNLQAEGDRLIAYINYNNSLQCSKDGSDVGLDRFRRGGAPAARPPRLSALRSRREPERRIPRGTLWRRAHSPQT
jgi:hypothetical protein